MSHTVTYFGMDTVERAIADYFATHGMNEQVRDRLMEIEAQSEDDFFEIVDNYVIKNARSPLP